MFTFWFLVVVNVIDGVIAVRWRAWREYSFYRPRTLWREMQRVQDERGGQA